MKVVLMSHAFSPSVGGVELTSEVLAAGFTRLHGDEVVVITRTPAGDQPCDFPFRVVREPRPWELLRELRRAEVVFHNNPTMRFYWGQLLVGRPWVVTVRAFLLPEGEPLPRGRRLLLLTKRALVGGADVVCANSRATAASLPHCDLVIPNSYRDDVFGLTNPGPRDRRRLVFVGRLDDDTKGLDVVIDSLARLREAGLHPVLTVVGDGSERPALEDRVGSLGLTHRVTFLGALTGAAVADVLNQQAVLVIPSRKPETFGTVALEGAACGCVVVGTDRGGLPEAVGPSGPLVPPGDVAALTETLTALISDPTAYEQFRRELAGHAARHHADVMVEAYRAALDRAVSDPAGRRGVRGTTRRVLRSLRRARRSVSNPAR